MPDSPPLLCVFAGLPGVGKTTLARQLAGRISACYLRIDTIEQALRDLAGLSVQGEGYALAQRVAADNLAAGVDVVADCCNPWPLTRRHWRKVSLDTAARHLDIEIVCSDPDEHRRRVEARIGDIPGLILPDWQAVQARDYQAWDGGRIVIDTAHRTVAECLDELLGRLRDA
ncbi:adenylyl-sulfate kinase [Chitiniphilus shinanonensis]|uniref:Adenylyl-sulfate kinase n=1 Tax=Chitiniphilus shinanonensis TaxID=553088 RepID=A0ABQ6BXF0_9NEIS|nr:AAA family ATPase [Chitiniphilus shinanonensis]GLS06366.1 adenylyl-sulfate kinase [Chitiniphilus shinanonensis]